MLLGNMHLVCHFVRYKYWTFRIVVFRHQADADMMSFKDSIFEIQIHKNNTIIKCRVEIIRVCGTSTHLYIHFINIKMRNVGNILFS